MESEDSDDLKKDAVLDLYIVVELFIHRWCVWCVCGVDVRVYEQILQLYPDERHWKTTSWAEARTYQSGSFELASLGSENTRQLPKGENGER